MSHTGPGVAPVGEVQEPKQNITGMNGVLCGRENWDKVHICLQGVAQASKVGLRGQSRWSIRVSRGTFWKSGLVEEKECKQ